MVSISSVQVKVFRPRPPEAPGAPSRLGPCCDEVSVSPAFVCEILTPCDGIRGGPTRGDKGVSVEPHEGISVLVRGPREPPPEDMARRHHCWSRTWVLTRH